MADINLLASQVAERILSIGLAADLKTADKSTLVAAINEVLAKESGGGVLRVNVTRAANGTFTADKTFAEIKAAYDAGSAVEAVYTNNAEQWGPRILPLAEANASIAVFQAYGEPAQGVQLLVMLRVTSGGEWGDFSASVTADNVSYTKQIGQAKAETVKAALDAITANLSGLTAEDVQYQGNIGSEQVQGTIDDAIAALAIGEPLDKSADYAASGAASVQAWATMTKMGDAAKYRVAAGRYQVYSDGAEYIDYITIIDSPGNTTRFVYITSCDISGPFVFFDVYSAASPGAAPVNQMYFSTEEHIFSIYGQNVILPDYTSADNDKVLTIKNGYPSWGAVPALPAVSAADNGKFLRVVSGAWAAQALTNVAEVGA